MATITEDYVSFEVAKLLKEKGFDIPCSGRYSVRSKEFHLDCTKMCNNGGLFECAAPTHQMAMKWLREVHNLIIEVRVKHHFRIFDGYYAGIVHLDGDVHYEYTPDEYTTYEEACEAAIKYCLENLI